MPMFHAKDLNIGFMLTIWSNWHGHSKPELQNIIKLPGEVFALKTYSKNNLKIVGTSEKFPVLIYNHGWGEHFLQNTLLMEELASNGYIIFSLAHHNECKFSIYPNGKLIILDIEVESDRFQKIFSEQTNSEAMNVFEKMFTAKNYDEQDLIFQRANELLPSFFIESPRLWSEDISFLLDKLIDLNKNKFNGLLDLNRIGVLGMSMGGIAAQQICIDDDRVKAGLSMDGGFYGDSYDHNLYQPFMFINSYRY